MAPLAITPADILRFAQDCAAQGVVLVTLTGIAGSSPRAIGAQMAVASDGSYRGSFSGGCIEAAIVSEALSALAAGESRRVRFGAGSPYIDIRLPCGGGIDLLFTPRPDPHILDDILARLDAREPAGLWIKGDGIAIAEPGTVPAGWSDDAFCVRYVPRLRIAAIGHGEALVATARLARFFGAETFAFSPLADDVTAASGDGITVALLETRTSPPALATDPWTAFAFLFHDHEWEDALLPWALRGPYLFVGAIGGWQSRANRRDMLRRAGFDDAIIGRFEEPAGLIPATRDPATLALSLVAEIVAAYQERYGGGACEG
ncbi:XdhC family protein [Sphingopyxis sp. OPL5]|uniref:XdhC family protein n=1 Tax=Sphingopyxis sp. OPL5 TaxID=2486273 RepID=UPI00164E8207|nr:XdhC family protein [Sphingopyxis sp. OPL5]QNO29123.1 XdhC family protein [Sphingopyxis sp. OPL5]